MERWEGSHSLKYFKASKDFPPITQGGNKASGWTGCCLLIIAEGGATGPGAEMGSGKWEGATGLGRGSQA